MNMRYIDDQKDLEDYNTVDINIEAEEKEQDEGSGGCGKKDAHRRLACVA